MGVRYYQLSVTFSVAVNYIRSVVFLQLREENRFSVLINLSQIRVKSYATLSFRLLGGSEKLVILFESEKWF
jgi:hypothetical protein